MLGSWWRDSCHTVTGLAQAGSIHRAQGEKQTLGDFFPAQALIVHSLSPTCAILPMCTKHSYIYFLCLAFQSGIF